MPDLHYALRTLRKSPGLVAMVVMCLGLGIGVNTTLFSLFDAALLQAPTAREPERLVHIEPGNGDQISYPNFRDLGRPAGVTDLAISARVSFNLRDGGTLQGITGLQVSANYFDVFGVPAWRGRTFSAGETPETNPRVALLEHGFALRHFPDGGEVIGRTLRLNGETFTVIGILDADYRPATGLLVPDVYVAISPVLGAPLTDRRRSAFELHARLAPGVTREQARDAFQAAAGALETAYPRENEGFGRVPLLLPLSGLASVQGRGTPAELPIVLAAPFVLFGLLLGIACANVSGILLARGASRRAEMAVRLAVGASRARLVRLLLAECFVLTVLATAAGVVLTVVATPLLNRVPLPNVVAGVRVPLVTVNLRLLLFATAAAILTCLVCGLVPALQATRLDLTANLREAGVKGRRRGARRLLVGAQVAASALLLVAGASFLRSLLHVATVDPGFDVQHGVTALVNVEENRFPGAARHLLAERLADRLRAVPGVASVSFASLIPLGGDSVGVLAQRRDHPDERGVPVETANVGPDYFKTMGIAVVNGREFRAADRPGAPPVIIVNEAFVRRAFEGAGGVGRHIRVRSEQEDDWREIVAVVADSRYGSLTGTPGPQVFLPYLQTGGRLFLQVRMTTPVELGVPAVRQAIGDVDSTLLATVQTTKETTSVELTMRRLATLLLGAMGTLGVLLAMVGLFGTLAWEVTRRTTEIGIRMALGASQQVVRKAIVRDGLRLVGAATAVGLAAGVLLMLPLRSFLAGVSAADPLALGGVTVLLLAVAAAASAIPAHRASSIDPNAALRRE